MRAAPLPPQGPDSCAARRVVVAVAHPDDEVLGCGALLATLRDVWIVHVTDGAPRDGMDVARSGFATPANYAAARRLEALEALAIAGVPAARLHGLDVADQAAADHLVAITHRLVPLIEGAEIVLTHAYEGGHPDHDAVAFAVRAAATLCRGASPAVWEMPFYYGDDDGWVRQHFLPQKGTADRAEIVRPLTPAERERKAKMIGAHRTQAATLSSFSLDAERFRPAPLHDFARRPHDGPLLYERHGWTLTWPRWHAQVEAAVQALGLAAR